MRLEQVLAQWAKGISISGGTQVQAGTSVAGRWTNEYGSIAEIAVDGDRIFGTYTSAVGGPTGSMSGPINGFVRGDIVAFAVLWPVNMRSITSWVGQVVEVNGAPVLKTLWHLIIDIPDADEATGLWTTRSTPGPTHFAEDSGWDERGRGQPARPMVLPPFDPWLTGIVVGDAAWAAYAGADALAFRRSRRLADLVTSAARDSPLYRRLLKGLDLSSPRLQDLPVVRKAELMRHFGDWVTDPRIRLDDLRRFTADRSRIAEPFLGRYVVWESSGSSGEPAIFVQDAAAMAVYDALEALRRPAPRPFQRLLDPWYLGERIAFVGATGGHFASTVSAERLRRLNPALAGSLHEISFLQSIERLVDDLHALSPTILSTYPSAAVMLAEERLAGRLRVQPKEVWTGGETLSPSMRRFVREAFGCPVVDSYGASEFLSLALECRFGCLHLNSDWAILESVDSGGHAVPADEIGATSLLTNLANRVQPLIRYDLGDRIKLHSQLCECGSHLPVIEVQGRSDDPLLLRAPGRRAVRVLPLALTTVLEDDAGLFDFQFEQQGPCDLRLQTPMRGDLAEASLTRARTVLEAFLARQGVPGVQIHCHSGQPSRRGPGGKIRRVAALAHLDAQRP